MAHRYRRFHILDIYRFQNNPDAVRYLYDYVLQHPRHYNLWKDDSDDFTLFDRATGVYIHFSDRRTYDDLYDLIEHYDECYLPDGSLNPALFEFGYQRRV